MSSSPKALLFKFPGTNCDAETARALEGVGFEADIQPISLIKPESLQGYNLLVFSGGFSYGDYVMAGRLAQLEIERRLGSALQQFYRDGGYLLGICNGFQILTKLGILPEASLIENTSGRFVCRWATLEQKTLRADLSAGGRPWNRKPPTTSFSKSFLIGLSFPWLTPKGVW